MDPSVLFGITVGLTLFLAWASGSHVLQKVGLLLMLAWAGSNLAVGFVGFARAPLFVPSLDALVTLLIAMVGYRNHSNVSLAVVCIYAIVGAVHVAALTLRMQETYTYYASLNLLFLAQLLIVGGSGAWLALRNWTAGRDQRASPHHPRSAYSG